MLQLLKKPVADEPFDEMRERFDNVKRLLASPEILAALVAAQRRSLDAAVASGEASVAMRALIGSEHGNGRPPSRERIAATSHAEELGAFSQKAKAARRAASAAAAPRFAAQVAEDVVAAEVLLTELAAMRMRSQPRFVICRTTGRRMGSS